MKFDFKKMIDDPIEKIIWVIVLGVMINVLGSYIANRIEERRLKNKLSA